MMLSALLSPLRFSLFDLALTVTSFGFIESWSFKIDDVYEHFLLTSGYNFNKSSIEFLMISIFRFAIFVSCYSVKKDSLWKEVPITLFCIISACFSMLKLLACSVDSQIIGYPGVWILSLWSICSSILWIVILSSKLSSTPTENPKSQSSSGEESLTRWEQIRILLSYSLQDWHLLLISLFLTASSSAVSVMLPHYSSTVINGLTKIGENVEMASTIKLFAGLTVLSMFLTGIRGGHWMYLTSLSASRMRKDLFKSVINQDIAFFDQHNTGQIVSRLTSDVSNVGLGLSYNLNHSLRNFLTLGGKLIFMATLSWKLAIINMIVCPITFYVTHVYGEFTEKTGEELGESAANFHGAAQEIISTIRTVRAFAAEKISTERFTEIIDNADKIKLKESLARTGLHFTNDLYYNAIYGFTLMAGAHLVSIGQLEAATLVTFMMYQVQIGEHIVARGRELNWSIPQMMGTLGKSRKFCELLLRKTKIENDGRVIVPVKGEIKLDNVHFTYPSRPENPVLQNLSLHIRPGETLALVGPSGGGKSTIVSLLERFYLPDEGEITLDGISLSDFEHEYFHKKISLVPQEPVLYDRSIRDNIAFGCNPSEEEIIEAAKTANAHDFITSLEKGYDTSRGESGTKLSGGQKQRIAIARALVRNPSVLILDEATSALDNQSERVVQDAMQRCGANRTVIVIAHRLSTIEKADRIAVIDKGRVVQIGSHRELLKDEEGLYYSLVRAKDDQLI